MTRRMIFHYPFPLRAEISGSQVHLQQTLRAFRQIGYEVDEVTGYAGERLDHVRRLHAFDDRRPRPDFMYSWAPTVPSLASRRNIRHPLLDARLMLWCRERGTPVGLFYGDVHWRFPHFRGAAPWYWRALTVPLYWYDWLSYTRTVEHLFVPTLAMAKHLPTRWPSGRLSALYPGCNVVPQPNTARAAAGQRMLNVFYVGGVRPPLYDLRPMVQAVLGMEGVRLTLCCRAAEWAEARTAYGLLDPVKVQIVHAHGSALAQYYAQADLFGMFWKPYAYLDMAMPVKVFEAMGYGLPIVTSTSSEAARFISEARIGWAVADTGGFSALLGRLQADPAALADARRRVEAERHRHTWEQRAQQIASTLCAQ